MVTLSQLNRAFQNKWHKLFVDVTVTSFASYLGLKKSFNWSMIALLQMLFQRPVAEGLLLLLTVLCIYASGMKILLMIVSALPSTRIANSNTDLVAQCLITANREISDHINNIKIDPTSSVKFEQNHKFDQNLALIVDNLHGHIQETLQGAGKRDIFISAYQVANWSDLSADRTSLQYVCHSPNSNDGIRSREIVFSDSAHAQYECVKCIKGTTVTVRKLNCSDYYRDRNHKRHKTVTHYIGARLEQKLSGQTILLGFLNIEFHNKTFFSTEAEMVSFVEDNVLAFKYLMEYQFLKAILFRCLRSNLKG